MLRNSLGTSPLTIVHRPDLRRRTAHTNGDRTVAGAPVPPHARPLAIGAWITHARATTRPHRRGDARRRLAPRMRAPCRGLASTTCGLPNIASREPCLAPPERQKELWRAGKNCAHSSSEILFQLAYASRYPQPGDPCERMGRFQVPTIEHAALFHTLLHLGRSTPALLIASLQACDPAADRNEEALVRAAKFCRREGGWWQKRALPPAPMRVESGCRRRRRLTPSDRFQSALGR
jgi:hypothetical protein